MTFLNPAPHTVPPLTLLTCEACDGCGGYEEADNRWPAYVDDPYAMREVECPYCKGFGAIVFEGETDTEQGEAP